VQDSGHKRTADGPFPGRDREYGPFFHVIEQFGVLKKFQNDLYQLTGLPFDFMDLRLWHSKSLQAWRVFTPFCRLVNNTPLGCRACELDEKRAIDSCVKKQGCVLRRCHLGLIDVYVPIVMNGKIAGLFCTGQLFYRRPTEQGFRKIQKRLADMGVDLIRARQAYFNAPVIEKRRVAAIIDLVQMVVGLIDVRRLQALKSAVSHDSLRKALDFMETHYAEPITLSLVAREADLSVSRMAHVFKDQVGMSFTAYLNLIRINWAKYYLTNSNLRIGETAFHVGFGNLSHFNHVFLRAAGLPPTQYRRQHASTSK